ncbi:MAG: aminotransferase class I/II-fold pyridoxal phosphate-dependent enzyme [Nitrospiraceae bacterium]|nr:aminotransferase class I/II-fold pyridoxal phosphate-dependent enzyme [Nitrospiraceae bacterium]
MSDNLYFFKGRVGLYAILKAIGLRNGDEVILPGFTCVVVPNAIKYLGAKPCYIDIDPNTFNIDPEKINEKISRKTRAIIAQHTFGIPAEIDAIIKIAKKYNLFVIEDSCHAIGSKYKGWEVGTYGDAAFFSSQWSKPVTSGLGGWVKANNPELKRRLAEIHASFSQPSTKESLVLRMQYLLHEALLTPSLFWITQEAYRKLSKYGFAIGSSSIDELSGAMPAHYAKKMTDWQEKLVEKKLSEIATVIEHRVWAAAQYDKLLPQAGFEPSKLSPAYEAVFLRYPVRIGNKKALLHSAKKNMIEMGDWFVSPVHPNLSGWEKIGYEKGMCPNAERACELTVNLPTHTRIGSRQIEKTVNLMSNFI